MVETEGNLMKMYLGDRVRFFSDSYNDWLRGEILDISLEKSSGGTRFEPYVTIALNFGDVMRFRARGEDLKRKQFTIRFSDHARVA
jgi:hypothetical protein